MSAIFISHSSKDSGAAATIRDGLRTREYRSLFLDFDPSDGIPAGRDWEGEIYTRLRACQAVVVLCSEHSMASRWVFAEVSYARAEGKEVVPIKVGDCTVDPRLKRHQVIDATAADWPEVLERLVRGLEQAGLGPGHYDPGRPPYPGLRPFEEEDAAVFFGRTTEIREFQDRVNRVVNLELARLLMVVGASGSGKSSLVRAGLVPRLRRNDRAWLVVDPFRPESDPVGNLATVLGRRFAALQGDDPAPGIRAELLENAATSEPSGLVRLADRLRDVAGCPRATVVLVVDQFEELLGRPPSETAGRFLDILRSALETEDSHLIAIGTLRSDRFPDFQRVDLRFDDFPLGPMRREGFREVIEGPAALAGIELDEGLVDTVLGETEESKTPDALPLLAFALHELWRNFGDDRRLETREYRDLGGLEGCIARSAEDLLEAHLGERVAGTVGRASGPTRAERPVRTREGDLVLPPDFEEELRSAFGMMVRLDDEGRLTRIPVDLSRLPEGARGLIDRFVEKRLLRVRTAPGEDDTTRAVVEASHEALFRAWKRLSDWLAQDRQFLQWRDRTRVAADQWEREGQDEALLLRGRILREARDWLEERPAAIDARERTYIEASARSERRRRTREISRRVAGVAAALLLVAAVIVVWIMREREQVQRQLDRAGSILAAVDARAPDDDPLAKALLLTELSADAEAPVPEGGLTTALAVIQLPIPWLVLEGGESEISAAVLSPDGSRAVVGAADGSVRIWTLDGGPPLVDSTAHRGRIRTIEFSADGSRFVTASADSTARVWRTAADGARPLVLEGHAGPLRSAAFDLQASRVVTASDDGTARIWGLDDAGTAIVLRGHRAGLWSASFGPNGSRVVTASRDSTARIWSAQTGESLEVLADHQDMVWGARFSHDATRVLTASRDGTARLWSVHDPSDPRILGGHQGAVWSARFSPSGAWIVTASADDTVRVWPGDGRGAPAKLVGHTADVWSAGFSADDRYLVTASADGTARLWSVDDWAPLSVLRHERGSQVQGATFSADARLLLTSSSEDPPRVWRRDSGLLTADAAGGFQSPDSSLDWRLDPTLLGRHRARVERIDIGPDGSRAATAALDSTAGVWSIPGTSGPLILHEHRGIVFDARFAPEGDRIVTASQDDTVRVWRLSPSVGVIPLGAHEDDVLTAAFSPSGDRVITGSSDRTARIWSAGGSGGSTPLGDHRHWVRTLVVPRDSRIVTWSGDGVVSVHAPDGLGEPTRLDSVGGDLTAADIDPEGRRVAVAALDGRVWVWDVDRPGEAKSRTLHQEKVNSVSFSPGGDRVVTASEDHTARVWEVSGADQPIVLSGHRGPVNSAFFGPDGETVVTASDDATVRIWSRHGGAARTVLHGRGGAVIQARYGPDGRFVVGGSDDGSVRVWALELSRVVSYVRHRARACLTAAQRQRFLGELLADARAAAGECRRQLEDSAASERGAS